VLDPGLVYRRGRTTPVNEDPLRISTPHTWSDRPGATTAVPNLLLAADYLNVQIDTATMEGANEAGRRAANAIVARAGSPAKPARVFDLYQPPEWEPVRAADAQAYARGLPNPIALPAPPG
jgi:uncharacterized protein with NAD-binding domain and iron-sulfur cluster